MTEAAATLLQAAFRSDPGRVRTNNEDLPLLDAERGIFGVIDGVGGQAAGELAAAIASDVIRQRLARPLGTAAERVREAIALANNEIFRRSGASPELAGMTCVVTLALASDARLTIGHVGDSRLYKIRPGGMEKLTHDHSPVGEREDAGELTERDAMRHPRRNEVFRDVGGALRDKDEDDYVEVIEAALEPDAAILVCTDGLTDMVTTAAIERLVRQNAGSPQAVADALIVAANDAGGRDNVTVVYAEAPEFARAVTGQSAGRPATEWIPPASAAADRRGADDRSHLAARLGRWILFSRVTWFALGSLLGILGALWLVFWRSADVTPPPSRTIVVTPTASTTGATLQSAVAAARPGDVVQMEPGVYGEQLRLGDGVSLVARLPSSVTFVRAPVENGEWVAITAGGDLGGRISGIRIESTAELPVDVGVRLGGQGRSLDLVEILGPMHAGVDLLAGSASTLNGSRLTIQGTSLAIADRAQAVAWGNVFLRKGKTTGAPVRLGEGTVTSFRGNVFIGYATDIVAGATPAERQQVLSQNVMVPGER